MDGVLRFDLARARRLWAHAQAATTWRSLYGQSGDAPGLWLVKDRGAYLMSNADPGLVDTDGSHHVVYADALGPDVAWSTLQELCGGDDFCELLDAPTCIQLFADPDAQVLEIVLDEGTFACRVW